MASGEVAIFPAEGNGEALRRALLAGLLFLVYASLFPATTGDMRHFLLPWLDTILERGVLRAFSTPFSNYTPPYLYLLALVSPLASVIPKISVIKALSLAGTALVALAVRHLLRVTGRDRSTDAALWLTLVPSVAINGAAWGQCDAFWSAACVMAVASAIQRREVAMLLWFGVGIAFKAQAIFLAPFIAQRLIVNRTPFLMWSIPGLVYATAMLPAAIAGWPLLELFTVYFHQAAWGPYFLGNAGNPWSIVQLLAPAAGRSWLWLGYVAASLGAVAYLATNRRSDCDARTMIALALLSALLIPFLLPKMHERFFFLADVLAFALLVARGDRRSLLLFVLVEGSSMAAVVGVMVNSLFAPVLGCALTGMAIVLLARSLGEKESEAPHDRANQLRYYPAV